MQRPAGFLSQRYRHQRSLIEDYPGPRKTLWDLARESATAECQQIQPPPSFVRSEIIYGDLPLIMRSSLMRSKMTKLERCLPITAEADRPESIDLEIPQLEAL